MQAAAGRARDRLRERRGRLVRFLLARLNDDGGFQGRRGGSDLYYTVFGVESLRALGAEVPAGGLRGYLRSFGTGNGLDLVHLASLARCSAALRRPVLDGPARRDVLRRVERCRKPPGGYALTPQAASGTAYGCFLALGAWQDLGGEMPDPEGPARCLEACRTADGGYANRPGAPAAVTPATAAAVVVLRQLARPVEPASADWLLARRHASGGFLAAPAAPLPDLLSTATALHALDAMGIGLDGLARPGRKFVESLWSDAGGFRGHWADDDADCEYTYYGLLALGHLSP